jgi:hypothetical protein
MNLFNTTFMVTTSAPIPPNVSTQDVLNLLHDHIAMMCLSPLVAGHTAIPSPDAVPAWDSTFLVTEQISYFLCKGKVKFQASFRNTADGLETKVKAALGVTIEAVWKVEKQPTSEGMNPELVFVDSEKVTCPWLLRPLVERNLRTSHQEVAQAFVKRLQAA